MPTLDVIIVNWNSGDQLRNCLASLPCARKEWFAFGRVVVVDNASTDTSLGGLDTFGFPLMLLQNDSNRGFAVACNQGAKASQADYLLFLNPDTVLDSDSLAVPLQFLEKPENSRTGVCGISLFDAAGMVTRSCARFPSAATFLGIALGLPKLFRGRIRGLTMEDWNHEQSREVDHVIGAFYLVRRKIFAELGGFDERFFVYLEDLDLSFRVRQAGWGIVYLSEGRAFHRGGGTSEQIKAMRLYYVLGSRLKYAFKHFGALRGSLVLLATLLLEPFIRVAYGILKGDFSAVLHTLGAYVKLLRALPALIVSERPCPAKSQPR